jgi:hypothetical protein
MKSGRVLNIRKAHLFATCSCYLPPEKTPRHTTNRIPQIKGFVSLLTKPTGHPAIPHCPYILSSKCPKRSLPSASLLTYTETEVPEQGNNPYPSSSMVTSFCSHPRTSVQISPLCISPTAICKYVSSYDFPRLFFHRSRAIFLTLFCPGPALLITHASPAG